VTEAFYVMAIDPESESDFEPTRQQRLGAAIREARKKCGWNQTELAERIGSSQSYISLLEKGRVGQPGERLLSRLAVSLKVDLNDLLTEAGWPDMSAYLTELQEAQAVLAGLSGKRVEIMQMLLDMSEARMEKVWSYTSYLHEEQAHYDQGPTEILEEDWQELLRLAPRLPREAARTFAGMPRLMIPEEPEEEEKREAIGS
jgi:transcriptional regulator with XRE-family HTH domain